MKRYLKRQLLWMMVLTIPFAIAFYACGGDDDDDDDDNDDSLYAGDDDETNGYQNFLNALPDPDNLQLTIPGSEKMRKALGEMAKYYDETVDITRLTNDWIFYFLSVIDEITSYEPTSFDGVTAVWGPVDGQGLEPVDWRFTIVQRENGGYDYQFEWRPKESTGEDWQTIWSGAVDASSSTERRGIGNYTLDFTVAKSLDPTVDHTGALEVIYDTLTAGRVITVHYTDFWTEDYSEPVNGVYDYLENEDGSGAFLWDIEADLHYDQYHGEQYAEAEHMWFHTQWNPTGDGRCDVVVTDGDLPDMEVPIPDNEIVQFNISECWDDHFLRVYYMEEIALDPWGIYTIDDNTEGDINDCTLNRELPAAY